MLKEEYLTFILTSSNAVSVGDTEAERALPKKFTQLKLCLVLWRLRVE